MSERKTIFIVTAGEYSDYGVLCAYENEDDARIAVENGVGDDYRELPLLPPGAIPGKVPVHHAQAGGAPGAAVTGSQVWTYDEWDFDAPAEYVEEVVRAPGFVGVRFSGTDKERVQKAAQDRTARMRAEQEGIA